MSELNIYVIRSCNRQCSGHETKPMAEQHRTRRQVLAVCGLASVAGLSGCSGQRSEDVEQEGLADPAVSQPYGAAIRELGEVEASLIVNVERTIASGESREVAGGEYERPEGLMDAYREWVANKHSTSREKLDIVRDETGEEWESRCDAFGHVIDYQEATAAHQVQLAELKLGLSTFFEQGPTKARAQSLVPDLLDLAGNVVQTYEEAREAESLAEEKFSGTSSEVGDVIRREDITLGANPAHPGAGLFLDSEAVSQLRPVLEAVEPTFTGGAQYEEGAIKYSSEEYQAARDAFSKAAETLPKAHTALINGGPHILILLGATTTIYGKGHLGYADVQSIIGAQAEAAEKFKLASEARLAGNTESAEDFEDQAAAAFEDGAEDS